MHGKTDQSFWNWSPKIHLSNAEQLCWEALSGAEKRSALPEAWYTSGYGEAGGCCHAHLSKKQQGLNQSAEFIVGSRQYCHFTAIVEGYSFVYECLSNNLFIFFLGFLAPLTVMLQFALYISNARVIRHK